MHSCIGQHEGFIFHPINDHVPVKSSAQSVHPLDKLLLPPLEASQSILPFSQSDFGIVTLILDEAPCTIRVPHIHTNVERSWHAR